MLETSDLSHKTKQFFFVLIKLSIVIGAFYFIYNKLLNNNALNASVFLKLLSEHQIFSFKNIGTLLILSILNWLLEIKKWHILVNTFVPISFSTASKQSLAALTASTITPNRIGDYGAKAIYYKRDLRQKILLLNVFSNLTQLFITVVLGVIGLFIFIHTFSFDIPNKKLVRICIYILTLLVFIGLGFKYRNVAIRGVSIMSVITFFKQLSLSVQLETFLLSLGRYLIFSYQFYWLLLLFNIDISYIQAMSLITVMYLLASIIPSLVIFDIVIKGSIAIYLFDFAEVNNLIILCVTTLMWCLNFMLPSIIGSYFVLNFRLDTSQPKKIK